MVNFHLLQAQNSPRLQNKQDMFSFGFLKIVKPSSSQRKTSWHELPLVSIAFLANQQMRSTISQSWV